MTGETLPRGRKLARYATALAVIASLAAAAAWFLGGKREPELVDEAAFRAAVKHNDMLDAADPKAGAETFNAACAACHSVGRGEPNKMGPNLFRIVGSKFAARPGFDYSPALTELRGRTWTTDELYSWVRGPNDYAPGTKMRFNGLLDPQDRMDLIAYLMTLR